MSILNKINQESIIDHKALKENVSPDSRIKKKNKTIRTRNNNEPINPNDPSTWGKVGRNSPCPCRSGKKYKNCHG